MPSKLAICYVPGLDGRRVNPQATPFLSAALARYPAVPLRTLPSTELLPTLVTGVYPHQHAVWQVSLRREAERRRTSWFDRLPDPVATGLQCVRHFFDSSHDLACIPPRRRRRFELHRFKYTRRVENADILLRFGSYESLFGILGPRGRYRFCKRFDRLDGLLKAMLPRNLTLDFLEMYALDLFQHWNMDNSAAMHAAYNRSDGFVRRLAERCEREGWTLLVLVDHGQEPVVGTVPLMAAVREAGVSDDEFTCYVELAQARFWFHTDRARDLLLPRLRALQHTRLLTWRDMHAYHVCFENDAFGEFYLMANPGYMFFPHDFYHPAANIALALLDRSQRTRLRSPVHRANHGYLPEHPSERGYAVLLADGYRAARSEGALIDFAPSVLALLGLPRPSYMQGTPLFTRGA